MPADMVEHLQDEMQWVRDAQAAVTAAVPTVIKLLADEDPAVRAVAAYTLAGCTDRASALLTELRARFDAEADPAVKVSLVFAAARLSEAAGVALESTRDWFGDIRDRAGQHPAVHLAAAVAGLGDGAAPDSPKELAGAFAAATTSSVIEVYERVPGTEDLSDSGGFAVWLGRLLGDAPAACVDLTRRLAASTEPAVRAEAVRVGTYAAQTWRSATPETVATFAGLLNDPDGSVACSAARALARCGHAAATVSDHLHRTLERDDGVAATWASVALAHCGDPRAIAPLVRLLGLEECPWTHWDAPSRLLDNLRPHAAQLLPAIRDRIDQREWGESAWRVVAHDLIRGLGTWGRDAAPAVPWLLIQLIRRELNPATIVTALGRIGPAARSAASLLEQLAGDRSDDAESVASEAAWALWRITGSSHPSLSILGRLAGAGRPQALRHLGDLGPAARHHATTARRHLGDKWDWVRIEAAHAHWRLTGDDSLALPALLDEITGLTDPVRISPAQYAAVRYLGRLGRPAAAAAPTLRAILDSDHRTYAHTHDSGHSPISSDQDLQSQPRGPLSVRC
ncbi:MAG: hypothetical protein ACRDT6_02370 [Micromonosporaceae bacterium]